MGLSLAWKGLYPFQSRFYKRGILRLHHLDEGAGEPVVMVHGNPTWSFYFRDLVRDLSVGRRVIVPDHMGMGLSDRPDDGLYDHRLESRIDDLDALLCHLGVEGGVTMVVHDWGGMIGLGWAARHPERLKRLVVMNTAAFPPLPGKPLPWQLALARGPLGALLVRGANAFSRGACRSCVVRPMAPEVRAGYLAPYSSWKERRAVHRFVQDIPAGPGHPSWDAVGRIGASLDALTDIPALILWGAQDFVFDRDYYEEWRRRLPRAQARLLPGAGHFVLEDAAAEIVPAVRDFLERHPLASPL